MKWKKLTQGLMGNLFYAFLGLLVAVVFYYGILRVALATDLPMVAVVSNSMKHDSSAESDFYGWLEKNLGYDRGYVSNWPVTGGFATGDMPVVKGDEEYKVGDIIVYSVPGSGAPIIHRIIKINPDGSYQTKGDNNPSQLPYELDVKKEQIHGKVLFVVPKVGYLKVFFSRITGV